MGKTFYYKQTDRRTDIKTIKTNRLKYILVSSRSLAPTGAVRNILQNFLTNCFWPGNGSVKAVASSFLFHFSGERFPDIKWIMSTWHLSNFLFLSFFHLSSYELSPGREDWIFLRQRVESGCVYQWSSESVEQCDKFTITCKLYPVNQWSNESMKQ